MSDVEKPEVEEAVAGSANGEDANREAPDPTTGYAPLKFKDPMELSFLAPLPYNITIHSIPNIGETRGIWRTGMQTLEQTFAQVIQQMTMEFDSKLVEFERVRNEIVANHDFLTQWYKDMQRKLNEKNDQILLER